MALLASYWFLISVVLTSGAVVTYVTCPGCIDRNRVNRTCAWTGDIAFAADARNESHQWHLVADAQLAEELAIRHADAEFGRRFGVEHHGGLIDNGNFRRECLSRLFNVIENNHNVTSEQIQVARRQRNRVFDAAVVLLFLPIYSLATIVVARSISNRFSADGRYIRLAATALATVPVTVLGVQCFRLFAAVWETVRVGNGHMTGLRAASDNRWTQHYVSADFVGAALLFWFIGWFCYRAADRSYTQRLPGPKPGSQTMAFEVGRYGADVFRHLPPSDTV